jgi:single-stranded-DNA-specific exonuclease
LHDAVAACSDFLEAFGGHAAAAGMKLDPRNLAAFAQRFDEECKRRLTHEQLRRTCLIDAEVPFDWLTLPVVEQMEQLEPHGIGNPRPLLLASDVEVVGPPQTFGKAGEHVGLTLRQGNCTIRSVGWRKAEKWAGLMPGARVSLVFHASINEWNGRRHVRIEIEDLELEPCEHGRGSASRGASAQG